MSQNQRAQTRRLSRSRCHLEGFEEACRAIALLDLQRYSCLAPAEEATGQRNSGRTVSRVLCNQQRNVHRTKRPPPLGLCEAPISRYGES
jgi:hypothetical protein